MTPHITICVCTFKRSALLPELLRHLESQRTDGMFTFDVVIADNDSSRSAEDTVSAYAAGSPLQLTYCVEAQQNIALARNRALACSRGDLVAFIDDDEVPAADWLYRLFRTRAEYGTDGVLGPVLPQFRETPPDWITKGRFFDRPRYRTGTAVKWPDARTGNVLLVNGIWDGEPAFRPLFGDGGEDVDFFRRMSARGRRFIWCDEAVVHEVVPPYRCTRRFLMRRALMRGSNFPKQSGYRFKNALKSLVAVPCYTLALPVLALLGHHYFIAYLVKLLDHSSRLLALAGLPLLTEREI